MKSCLSLVLALFFTMSASASTGAVGGLNQILNEYQYSLTVEWDQKDPSVRKEITESFGKGVKELLSKNPMSREELLSVVKSRVGSTSQLEALEFKLALLPKDLSADQQLVQLLESVGTGAEGASWNGDVIAKSVAGLLLVGMVLIVADSIQQGKCLERSTVLETFCSADDGCYDYYPCLQRENESWF